MQYVYNTAMIEHNFSDTFEELNAVIARMDDFVSVFDAVGAYVVTEIEQRIKYTKLSPDNEPWAAWSPMTQELRIKAGNEHQGILWDTGALLSDLSFQVDGNEEVA